MKKTLSAVLSFALVFAFCASGVFNISASAAGINDFESWFYNYVYPYGSDDTEDNSDEYPYYYYNNYYGDAPEEFCYVNISLATDTVLCDAESVVIDRNRATITEAGCYILSGTLEEGQIFIDLVDCGDVQLILDNARIFSKNGSAVSVIRADLVTVCMPEDTDNVISAAFSSRAFRKADSRPYAFYSCCDAEFRGEGALGVRCENGYGIVSDGLLKLTSGSYTFETGEQPLLGRTALRITDCNLLAVNFGTTFTDDNAVDSFEAEQSNEYPENSSGELDEFFSYWFNDDDYWPEGYDDDYFFGDIEGDEGSASNWYNWLFGWLLGDRPQAGGHVHPENSPYDNDPFSYSNGPSNDT